MAFATKVKDVVDTFNKAVDAFNKQDKPPVLSGLFDDKVVLVTVGQHDYYTGKANVLTYLQTYQWPVKPTFIPTTVQVSENHAGNVAHIIGTADWQDMDGDIDGTIRYAFNFVFKNGQWWLSTLWGSSD
jgi:ketosteroid isomerase-like protein